ncbi:MAG: hypothetical protein HY013_09195 [Candidatus Solibacter usitatus]|nr:hypothetical protein [Candidatus Solibacter usitatus]
MNATVRKVFRSLGCGIAPLALSLGAQTVQHPLDPLSFQEYWTVLEVLRDGGRLSDQTQFPAVSLKEPPKDLVWAWREGKSFPREAVAIVRQAPKSYEAVIDLNQRKELSWKEILGAHPGYLNDESKEAGKEAKKHPEVIAALKRRGIENLAFVECHGFPPGYFGTPEQRGKRLLHVGCSDARRMHSLWSREIPGLTIVFDVDAKKVLRVVDEGGPAPSEAFVRYDAPSAGPSREVPGPLRVEQPLGPGFRLKGNVVEWQNWRFHYRHDQRTGAVISTVAYRDGAELRPILYQGHLSEIFVPYMDPEFAWYHRNFLDVGEFHSDGLAKPLKPGLDCPAYAVYSDALVADSGNGRPKQRRNVMCLFEREAGDMSWRHHSEEPESRRKRDLVVRFVAVLGNYDYVFDWTFQQDGVIRVAVGATGVSEAKSVAQATAAEPVSSGGSNGGAAEPADAYGRFVDRNIVAVNHDHYFSFRLDVDIDGPANTFVADRLVPKTLPEGHPRRSLWVREEKIASNESDGQLHMNMSAPALWRVVSSSRKNHVGYPTSYQLMGGMNAHTLLAADDYPRRRAGFIDHQLWVTPYRAEERYAAGQYPSMSEPGQGLPAWTRGNRSIRDTDIVLWHTIGMHHVVRGEDWPVMPVMWHSFELRPFDFFNRNPALDLPSR